MSPPICQKPQISCQTCQNRKFLPLTDKVIQRHLDGKIVVGLYPMHDDETCSFLAVDFDKKQWQEDVIAFTIFVRNSGFHIVLSGPVLGMVHMFGFFSDENKVFYCQKIRI